MVIAAALASVGCGVLWDFEPPLAPDPPPAMDGDVSRADAGPPEMDSAVVFRDGGGNTEDSGRMRVDGRVIHADAVAADLDAGATMSGSEVGTSCILDSDCESGRCEAFGIPMGCNFRACALPCTGDVECTALFEERGWDPELAMCLVGVCDLLPIAVALGYCAETPPGP